MSKPSFPLRGDLKVYSVNRLLQTVLAEKLDGCLAVSRGSITRRIYLKQGMITYASSTERSDRLGEIFIAQGLLTKTEIDIALRQGSPLRRLGMILLVEGKISSQELFQGVSAQVVTILERMRSWRKGSFEFESRREPQPGTVLMRIPLALYFNSDAARKRERQPDSGSDDAGMKMPPGLKFIDDEPRPAAGGYHEHDGGAEDGESTESCPPGLQLDEEEVELTPDELFGVEPFEEEEENASAAAGGDFGSHPRGIGQSWGEIDMVDVDGDDVESGPAEDEKLTEEIAFQIQELRSRLSGGSYKLLGHKPTASIEEIQESFHYFARLLHPDQLPENLPGELAGAAADLYREVAAAYEEVSTKVRADIHTFPSPPGRILAPPAAQEESMIDGSGGARRFFYRAQKFMEKGNYWQAAEALRDAVRIKPDEPEFRSLLGFCLVQTGRRLHEAEEHIKEAIRLDPGNPDYVANLGLAYKSGRFYKKARNMFQQALLYDKGHEVSKRELRGLPLEVERSDRTKSFWGKIFGK